RGTALEWNSTWRHGGTKTYCSTHDPAHRPRLQPDTFHSAASVTRCEADVRSRPTWKANRRRLLPRPPLEGLLHRVAVEILQCGRDRAWVAGAERGVVDLRDRNDLDHRRSEKRLVCQAQVGGEQSALDDADAVRECQIDHHPARDAGQDAAFRRGPQRALAD